MARRALAAAAILVLAPAVARRAVASFPAPAGSAPEGRGIPPRPWIGCAGDPGPPRDLDGPERLAVGHPIDLNRSSARDLAGVPGLSAKLAEQVVSDRRERGAFASVEELVRVRGVGPARLARARPYLVVGPGVVE